MVGYGGFEYLDIVLKERLSLEHNLRHGKLINLMVKEMGFWILVFNLWRHVVIFHNVILLTRL